jgi:hypothetical protein
MVLPLVFLATVAAQHCHQQQSEAADGSCLLAKKKMMGKASMIQEDSMTSFEHSSLKRKDWRSRHRSLETAMNKSQSLLDKFIEAQTSSKDHCSARLMESKRVLDGILGNLRVLSKQVTSKEEVVETETENLKITKLSISAVTTEFTKQTKICKEEHNEAVQELKMYSSELDELLSIANPSVRINIAHSVKFQKAELMESSSSSDLSLAQLKLDKKMCEAFVALTKRRTHRKMVADPKKSDCDTQREELQKAFEEAYIETRELKGEAKLRTTDKTCFETAETMKTSELVPLITHREIAVEQISSASQAIAAIDPVLNLVKEKAEKLRIHIDETLTLECADTEQASEVLERVRELILSLEECPGRNDFKLKIPAATKLEEEVEVERPEDAPKTGPEDAPQAE